MDKLANKLNITDQEGWYKITCATLLENGGRCVLDKYNNSPQKALVTLFPEYLEQFYDLITQIQMGYVEI